MNSEKPQVSPEHYVWHNYENKGRFSSYWHQINEIINLNPSKALMIGCGSGIVDSYLKKIGVSLTTFDIDSDLKPDITGSISNMPFKDESFDLVACFQVLEHLPLSELSGCLKEMTRISRKNIVISVPDRSFYLYLSFRIYPIFEKSLRINLPITKGEHVFDGEHYWEIGKAGVTRSKIRAALESAGLTLLNQYRVPEKPIHSFFIAKKINSE